MNLDKIPSEFIEPYLQKFLMENIEGVAMDLYTPKEARESLRGVEHFIQSFGGLHSTFAVSNMYGDFCRLSDEKMIEICKNTFKEEKASTPEPSK